MVSSSTPPSVPSPVASVDHLDSVRLAAIIESSADAIISKTLDGVVLSWNPAAERIFGYTAAEMVGSSVYRLVPDELHEQERQILARLRAGEHVAHFETERIRKDGRRILVALTISPIRDAEGTIVGASSIKRDITAQRELERQLHQAQKMEALGQLAGGVAHDFNNILTIIEGFTTFALRHVGPENVAHADLLGIRQASERAGQLTRQLLAFSRQQATQVETIDLAEVVRETAALLRRLLGEHIQLEVRGGPGAWVCADRGQIGQVLLNLAVNARDAMPQGGRLGIEVSVQQPRAAGGDGGGEGSGGEVCLVVADTGNGMDAATRARIFEPFFTTKSRGKGTGLGLAMVFGIVKQAHGRVEVESEPGAGATFRIAFPLAPAPLGGRAAPSDTAQLGGHETVLLVEDDPAIAELAARGLREVGYNVIRADGPGEALLAYAERLQPVDLLVTDILMPGMHGRALAERLRMQQPDLAVLYISGFARGVLGDPADGDADTPLLAKPFTPETLALAVRRALDGRVGR